MTGIFGFGVRDTFKMGNTLRIVNVSITFPDWLLSEAVSAALAKVREGHETKGKLDSTGSAAAYLLSQAVSLVMDQGLQDALSAQAQVPKASEYSMPTHHVIVNAGEDEEGNKIEAGSIKGSIALMLVVDLLDEIFKGTPDEPSIEVRVVDSGDDEELVRAPLPWSEYRRRPAKRARPKSLRTSNMPGAKRAKVGDDKGLV